MKEELYLNKMSNIVAKNRLLKFVVIVIGLATLYNTVAAQKALNSQKVVIVPAGLCTETVVEANTLSDDYLRTMTRYIIGLAANYNPASARGQFDELLRLYRPGNFPAAKKIFYDLASAVEVSKNTTAFYISKISVDKKKSEIEVNGQRTQFADSSSLSGSGAVKVYYIDYTVENGKFMITKFSEKAD